MNQKLITGDLIELYPDNRDHVPQRLWRGIFAGWSDPLGTASSTGQRKMKVQPPGGGRVRYEYPGRWRKVEGETNAD